VECCHVGVDVQLPVPVLAIETHQLCLCRGARCLRVCGSWVGSDAVRMDVFHLRRLQAKTKVQLAVLRDLLLQMTASLLLHTLSDAQLLF